MNADATWLDRLAHDLRSPLGPMQTASYLLQRDDLDPARRQELLAMLERQTHRLARMLDELDDWTRVDRGRLLGQRERCELALLLDYALVGSGLAGTPVEDAGAIVEVEGDQQRLTQLLRTLLDYSIACGAAPRLALGSGNGYARVEMRMPGPAPGAEALAVLFEQPQPDPFDQGLGLRLMLAREIARAHGGELTAIVDDGALAMRVELPLARLP
jgi:signal transduction histidine kinase